MEHARPEVRSDPLFFALLWFSSLCFRSIAPLAEEEEKAERKRRVDFSAPVPPSKRGLANLGGGAIGGSGGGGGGGGGRGGGDGRLRRRR